MKTKGIITQVRQGKGGVTLVIETEMGLRGVEMDRTLWREVMADFQLAQADGVLGWEVLYDPAHGDLEIVGSVVEEDSAAAEDDVDTGGTDA